MKKVSIVIRTAWIDDVLDRLRGLGVVHLQHVRHPVNEKTEELDDMIRLLEKAAALIQGSDKKWGKGHLTEGEAIKYAKELVSLAEKKRRLEEELRLLEEEIERIRIWGRFEPRDIEMLRTYGISIGLYICSARDLKTIPKELDVLMVRRDGSDYCIAAISEEERPVLPFQEVARPDRGIRELEEAIKTGRAKLYTIDGRVKELSAVHSLIKEVIWGCRERLDYERARAGIGVEGDLTYLTGFVPASEAEVVKREAIGKSWGILIDEPNEDDPVPTMLIHSRVSSLFQPVMKFIGVVPGYFEYDTNLIFMIFFALFFAMILGDGGYGLIMLVAVYITSKYSKVFSKELARLFYILSAASLLWGAITGSWFGSERLSGMPVLESLVVPRLSAFSLESEAVIMHLCFILAALHLSLAHLWKGLRVYPSLRAISEAGWITFIWGIYYLVRFLILQDEMKDTGIYLLFIGIVLVVMFSEQDGKGVVRGVVRGFAGLPVIALAGIGNFSNLVSYVRLFAVGLATREVAASFNSIALDTGSGGGAALFIALFVLIFGHTVNMILCALAVLVHAVRLNLLEFSGQLNIQWSGVPYEPFVREGKGRYIKESD